MGLLDKKKYLTGKDGLLENPKGETIVIHAVEDAGRGQNGPEMLLTVSREDQDRKVKVTVGGNLAIQAKGAEPGELPMKVKIGTVDTGKPNPAFTFESADGSTPDDDIPF
jgi:hypothetical protein